MKIPKQLVVVSGLGLLAFGLFVVLIILYFHAPDCLKLGDVCWGLNGAAWTAISAVAAVAYTVLTLFLVVFAAVQIRSARKDAKINRTLTACDRYDTDLLLDRAARRLLMAPDSLGDNPGKYRFDLESLLNYFETIAIGVRSGFYDEVIVRDQLERIFLKKVEQYLLSGIADDAKVADEKPAKEEYEETINLYRKWSQTAPVSKAK